MKVIENPRASRMGDSQTLAKTLKIDVDGVVFGVNMIKRAHLPGWSIITVSVRGDFYPEDMTRVCNLAHRAAKSTKLEEEA